MNPDHLTSYLAFGLSLLSTAAVLTWFMARQFASMKDFVFKQSEKILDKLEYHERHDDQRFSDINDRFTSARNDLWQMRLQLAEGNAKAQKESALRRPSAEETSR